MKTTKINLLQSKTLPLSDTFDRNQKYNVGSSESRSLIRISERGVSKYILLKLTNAEMESVAQTNDLPLNTFYKNYVVNRKEGFGVCIFQATYANTNQAPWLMENCWN